MFRSGPVASDTVMAMELAGRSPVAAYDTLAQSPGQAAAVEAFIWLGVVVVALLLGVVVVSYLRRKARTSARTPAPVFSLEQLCELHDRGDLTDAEYETLRRKLLEGD